MIGPKEILLVSLIKAITTPAMTHEEIWEAFKECGEHNIVVIQNYEYQIIKVECER
jgi:hypothetical protein